MVSVAVGSGTIECVEGDISVQDTDAVVNAANSALWMGSGVAGAIKRRGGAEIEREAVAKGPISPGEAVATGAGSLTAKFVIHAAGMGPDLRTDATLIRESTRNALLRAHECDCRSIAFPSIGTGVGGFPLRECAEIMVGEASAFLRGESSVELVRFVLFDQTAFRAFADELHTRGERSSGS